MMYVRTVRPFTLLLALLASASAGAATVTWTLDNVTFGDGGTATGSFVYDASTNIYSSISIVTSASPSWIPTTSYGVVDVAPSITNAGQVAFINTASAGALPDRSFAYRLLLKFSSPLTDAGGTASLINFPPSAEMFCVSPSCIPPSTLRQIDAGQVTGTSSVVPVPAAVWLFASAVGLMVSLRREVRA